MDEATFNMRAATLYRELANLHQERALALGASMKQGPKEDAAGHLKDLKTWIRKALKDRPGSTSAELAEMLYRPTLGIDRGTFKRRLIVAVSSMHKDTEEIEGRMGNSHREKKWYLRDATLSPTMDVEHVAALIDGKPYEPRPSDA